MRIALQTLARDFHRDRRGVFALWLGAAMIPLTLLAGAGLDLMRAVDFRSQLQAAVDAAALAGATAYTSSSTSSTATTVANNYMAGSVAKLTASSTTSPPTYTATPSAVTSGSATLYTMTVTAQGTMPTTLMKLVMSGTPVKVTATAQNPVYTITSTLSGFASSAYDANYIYWYVVPTDGGVPTSSAMTLLYSNTSSNSTKTVNNTVTAGQKIGYALKNVTGGITGYGRNGYGAAQGTTHWFYSHLMPPSSQAYSSVTKDCSLQVLISGSSGTLKSGSCLTALPTYAAVNCSEAAGKTLTFYWNDMGGGSDDYDYNDAVFKVSCSSNTASSQTGVVLTK
ncbi:TadE/TadG family type IV pilus assembly protein [Methylobacterium sp. J-077]|uniref:TadE/TadG family type IV pilus assembly protein n=1 Tax=Methylobacterium sp. J-077 TaxID=2836656 RepID=UPI001FBB475B|nr:pilus assembly protein TadG-related protein [Methylobacterium sp. J-077]MCJ2125758.1 pilus assembly protein TadG-related protein [Methylobacterium sp. J-077]